MKKVQSAWKVDQITFVILSEAKNLLLQAGSLGNRFFASLSMTTS